MKLCRPGDWTRNQCVTYKKLLKTYLFSSAWLTELRAPQYEAHYNYGDTATVYVVASLHCWRPTCPLSYRAPRDSGHNVMQRCRRNIRAPSDTQLTTMLRWRYGPIFKSQTTKDARGASWRGSEWWPHPWPRTRERDREWVGPVCLSSIY